MTDVNNMTAKSTLKDYDEGKISQKELQEKLANFEGEIFFVPVLVGNKISDADSYIGLNEQFGRIFIDNKSGYPLENFKTYLCGIRYNNSLRNSYNCSWTTVKIITEEDAPSNFHLFTVKVDEIQGNTLQCLTKPGDREVTVHECDLAKKCFYDLQRFTLLTVIAFKLDANNGVCYATLDQEFGDKLGNACGSSAIARPPNTCCEKTQNVFKCLQDLFDDMGFYHNFLVHDTEIRERLFSLMLDDDEDEH